MLEVGVRSPDAVCYVRAMQKKIQFTHWAEPPTPVSHHSYFCLFFFILKEEEFQ